MLLEAASPASCFAATLDEYWPDTNFPSLTADNLHKALLAEMHPSAVLCGAAWAAPYRSQHRELTAVARATDDRFAFYTLDVSREAELAAWMKVRVLPTTLVFRGMQIVARFTGCVAGREIHSALVAAAIPARR